MNQRERGGGREGGSCWRGSSLPATGALVVGVPVFLLALDGAVGSVPAAVVHGLLLAVVALGGVKDTSSSHHISLVIL